jgi:hypothetical protein
MARIQFRARIIVFTKARHRTSPEPVQSIPQIHNMFIEHSSTTTLLLTPRSAMQE